MWGIDSWGMMIWGGATPVPLLGPVGLLLMAMSFLVGGYMMQDRRRLGRFSAVGATVLIVMPLAAVATITLPNVFTNGSVADADEVNANFDTLATAVNYRTITRATGLGPQDAIDSGVIVSRTLEVMKDRADTALRIGYTDNFRAFRSGGLATGCSWEIRVDGSTCPSGALRYDYYVSPGSTNIHRQGSVVGCCEGLGAGGHTIQIVVTNTLAGPTSDCHTGFNASRWVIEAEEVF